ncbi:MAG TPA: DUF3891 family protein [Planctomycetaceae bacterium]|jgi:hypothetical protein|nr:DUF3891 family protein [Planctomycetaceae bacterium]
MIRRDDGDDWIIIEQIKHANLAAQIARAWGNEQFESLTAHPTGTPLHHAVSQYDDGWNEWDWAPRLDPRTGKPRDFREMRMSDATAIWSKSVRAAESPFPLAAYAVSRHFCYLAELVRDGGRHDADDLAAVTRFLTQQSREQTRLEQKAETRGWEPAFDRDRELAYRTVQFFDRVSLWLCCADEREPQPMTAPLGEVVTFSARRAPPPPAESTSTVYRLATSRPDFRRWHVSIEPYPLSQSSPGDNTHEFSVDARRIPARPYVDDQDLAATWNDAPSVRLVWMFSPGPIAT